MVPACAGLTVAPIVMVLAARAAEMAMIVRLIEVPVMFLIPFWRPVFPAPAQLLSRSVPSPENYHCRINRRPEKPEMHQGSADCANWRGEAHGRVAARDG